MELIAEGARLAAVGMGTVFVFLGVLVLATGLMSQLVARGAPRPSREEGAAKKDTAGDGRLVAVVTAAVHAHRTRKPDG